MQEGGITILDTHDILSDKIDSFRNSGCVYGGLHLSRIEEFELYECFDYVMAIQKVDHIKISSHIGLGKTLLVPHGVTFPKTPFRNVVSAISYVGSEYLPNVES